MPGKTNGKKKKYKRPSHMDYNNRAKLNGWDGSPKSGKKHKEGIKHIHA